MIRGRQFTLASKGGRVKVRPYFETSEHRRRFDENLAKERQPLDDDGLARIIIQLPLDRFQMFVAKADEAIHLAFSSHCPEEGISALPPRPIRRRGVTDWKLFTPIMPGRLPRAMADRLTAIDEPGFTAFWAVKLGDQVYWVKPERPISDETLEEWLTRMERGFGVHRSNIVAITKEQYEMIPRSDDEPVSVGWLPYE